MSNNNKLNKIRRSQTLAYGPGAIIDFTMGQSGSGAVSAVHASLDMWNDSSKSNFYSDKQTIKDVRLQRKLGVLGFRLPPVNPDDKFDKKSKSLFAVRFPSFLICPNCKTIKYWKNWESIPGNPQRKCHECSSKLGKNIFAVATRFVVACENGHLDDFPWHYWAHRGKNNDCEGERDRDVPLKLLSEEGQMGIGGLKLKCTKCNAVTSMKGIFDKKKTFKDFKCTGAIPWFETEKLNVFYKESCDLDMRALQRGSSNLYYPLFESSIMIPPFDDKVLNNIAGNIDLESLFTQPKNLAVQLLKSVLSLKNSSLVTTPDGKERSDNDIMERFNKLKKIFEYLENPQNINLYHQEYQRFTGDYNEIEFANYEKDDDMFDIREQIISDKLSKYISKLIKVVRLREVRALVNFARIEQPINATTHKLIPGSKDKKYKFGKMFKTEPRWRPAIENKGEGIFINLNEEYLNKWENDEDIIKRANEIHLKYENQSNGDIQKKITPRFLLLHTLSHALILELAKECGYADASLRERIYVTDLDNNKMCGILIFTSSSDSEGTLGGLSRQANPERFEKIFFNAIESQQICSQDPQCLTGIKSASEDLNHSACHSCILLSETSCELWNRFLDRSMIRGDIDGIIKPFFE
jgi:hypothetical protein